MSTPEAQNVFRNFNLCPHCIRLGQSPLLLRLTEGMPMISRSDGRTFHLLLADRPLPYPIERSAGPTDRVSLCFWYTPLYPEETTESTIVILKALRRSRSTLFRRIEMVADLLAEELVNKGQLVGLYELFESEQEPWTVPASPQLFDLPVPKKAH